jgi:heavy metal efflux system protein
LRHSRTGSSKVATDQIALDHSDAYVTLKPVNQWPTKRSKGDPNAAMRKKRLQEEALGAVYSFFATHTDTYAGTEATQQDRCP